MPPANLVFKDDVGGTLGTIVFTGVSPGVPSAATTFRLLNDDAGGAVDTAIQPKLDALQIDTADNEGKLRGLRAIDERWLQIRATGSGSSGSEQPATAFAPWGAGRPFRMVEILSGDYHELQVRYAPPGSADPGQIEFDMGADQDSRETTLEVGHYESGAHGTVDGIGDGDVTELIIGSVPTEQSPQAAGITFPDLAMIHEGIPGTKLTHDLAIDELDGSAAALAAGEAYWIAFGLSVVSGALSISVTKGNKATAPLSRDDIPDVPAGELWYASLERSQGNITDSDITLEASVAGWFFTAGSGLDGTIGPGRAMVDNRLIQVGVDTLVSFTANETSTVWILPAGDGAIAVTDAADPKPHPRAEPIWQVVTDGSVVTSSSDRRVSADVSVGLIDLDFFRDDSAHGIGNTAADESTDILVNDHVEFAEISSSLGVTFSTGAGQLTGLITLEAGRHYLLDASMNATFGGVTGTVTLQWRDNTGAALIGVAAVLTPKSSTGTNLEFEHGRVIAAIDPAVDTEVELRITAVSNLDSIDSASVCEVSASSLITPVGQPSADLISMSDLYLGSRTGYLLPNSGVLAGFLGAASATQGDLRVEVEIGSLTGSSWTTIYTSSGTDDRRARFQDGDPLLRVGGMPEVLAIPPDSPLRARLIVSEAFDVSPDLFAASVTLFIARA